MRNLAARLLRLERGQYVPPAPAVVFPGWDMVCGAVKQSEWLAQHGYADAVAAWEAGIRGPLLEIAALDCWLGQQGYVSAGYALADSRGEVLQTVPRGLEGELRIRALADYYHKAGDAIVGPVWREHLAHVTREHVTEWGQLREYLSQRPIPPPGDELLCRALRLFLDVHGVDVDEQPTP